MPRSTVERREATVRRTVYLPAALADAADKIARQGVARNSNELMVMALERMIDEMNEEAIDAEFAHMAHDEEYQREAVQLCREFAAADWEAFQSGERHDRDSGS